MCLRRNIKTIKKEGSITALKHGVKSLLKNKIEYNCAIVAYSEIGLKSEPVRHILEDMLISHLKNILELNKIPYETVKKERGRIYIIGGDVEKISQYASKVFGVQHVCPAIKTATIIDEIAKTVNNLADKILEPNSTFAIRARRVGEHPYTSKDLEAKIGSMILENFGEKRKLKVNLEHPDKKIFIEAREKDAYVYDKIFNGPGGLPLGNQGKVTALLSGGVDSAVASYLIMKRGATVIPLYLDAPSFYDEKCYNRFMNVLTILRGYVPLKKFKAYNIPFDEILNSICNLTNRKFTCILCKRAMYRIASEIAVKERAEGIVTGESLGQVASQTLNNLTVLTEASPLPIYRPLIGFDKNEIEEVAAKIGIRDIAAIKMKGCKAAPKKPATKSNIELIKETEKKLNITELVKNAVEGIRIIEM